VRERVYYAALVGISVPSAAADPELRR